MHSHLCSLCVCFVLCVSCALNAIFYPFHFQKRFALCVSVALCVTNAVYRYEIQPKCYFTALLSLKSYQKAEF